ncbi:MAG TPA: hypothetical protein VFB82_23175 [Blastocatellia bacterium]|nr:hypothetical protein [Blastocatellia bacterium]
MREYCPICATHHDPSVGCTDLVGEALHEAGIKRPRLGKEELKATIKASNRQVLILVIGFVVFLLLAILISSR